MRGERALFVAFSSLKEAKAEQIGFGRMLDELVESGYTGTELGDWSYMPTDPAALQAEFTKRHVVMLGAFVPVGAMAPPKQARGAFHESSDRPLYRARGGHWIKHHSAPASL